MAISTGKLTDHFNVDMGGGASYSIDLEVPPGTHDLAPGLAIAYNSGGGDGLLGVGWGLSGLSSITRTGCTLAQDGHHGAINYDLDDRFILDGQRLMAVSGDYGAPQAIYHTEIQTWRTVIPHYPSGWDVRSGPLSFTVHTRDGQTWEYGATPDSRVPASSTTPAIRLWSLNRVTDRHGNFMTVSYELDAQDNTHYPTLIEYTDNLKSPIAMKRQVRFSYTQRPLAATSYLGGHPIRDTRLLSQIQTFVGDTLVRTYRFDHQRSRATSRPLLHSVSTEARGTSLPPTTFSWQGQSEEAPTLFQPSRALDKSMRGGQRIPIDINGNGLTDVLHAYHVNFQVRLDLYYSTGSGLDGPFPVDLGTATLAWGGLFCPLDVDADGRMDLVYAVNHGGKVGLTLFKATLRDGRWTLVREGAVNGAGPSNLLWGGRLLALDADGDGLTDLVYATNNGSRLKLDVLYSNGRSFAPAASGPTSTSLLFGGYLLPLDLDGSGQTDLVYATEKASFLELSWLKARPDRTGYQLQDTPLLPSTSRIPWTGSLIPIHLNGDGQVDLVNPYMVGNTLHLRTLLNTGKGFVVQELGGTGLHFGALIPQLMPADVTGNGRDDLVIVGEHLRDGSTQKRRVAVLVNKGGTLRHHLDVSQVPALITDSESTMALGLSGVGKADLLHVDGHGAVHLLQATPEYPDLLASITNGLGGRLELTYKPITDASVYTRDVPPGGPATEADHVDPQSLFNNQLPGATYALAANPRRQTDPEGMSFASRSIQYPRFVVAEYSQVHSPTQRFKQSYKYENARLSLRGRGWLGFATWIQTDPGPGPAGVITWTRYHQEFPLTQGVKSQTVRRASDQTLMSQSEYDYATPASMGVHQRQTTEVRKKLYTFATSDTPDCVRTKTFQFDAHGNATSIILRSSEDGSKPLYTQQMFVNEPEKHRYGFMKERRLSEDPDGNQTLQWERMTPDPETWAVMAHAHWSHADTWLVHSYQYDVWGNQTHIESPARDVTTNHYDATWHTFLDKQVLPATASGRNLERVFQYDTGLGAILSETRPNGAREVHQYDGLGHPLESRRTAPDNSLAATMRFEHGVDSTGPFHRTMTRQEWSRDVWEVRTEYLDGFERVTRTSTQGQENGALVGRALLEDARHDAHAHLLAQTLPYFSGDIPRMAQVQAYDEFARIVHRETPGDGDTTHVTTYTHPHTNQVVITEGVGTPVPRTRMMTHRLHGDSRCLTELSDSQGHTTRFLHDALGRRLSAKDPNVETTFTYDGLGRHTHVSTRSGSSLFTQESYAYQDAQRTSTHTDGTGQVTTFHHDALQRCTSKQVGSLRTVYTYDEQARPNSLGHLTGVQLPDGTAYDYDHDPDGNTTSVKLKLDGTTYALDQDFTPTKLVSLVRYPDAARTELRYHRDALQCLLKISEGDKVHLAQSDFTALGAPAVARHGNEVRTTWTYSADGHLSTQDVFDRDERPVSASTLSWNPFWQVAFIQDRLEAPRSQSLSYDVLGQLVKAQGGAYGLQEFAYDGARNVTHLADLSIERSGHRISGGALPSIPDAITARYDDNGSLVQLRYDTVNYRYTYDGERRLQKVHEVLPGDAEHRLQELELMRFTYDHDGRRLTKVEPEHTTYYVAPCYEVVAFANGARQHTRSILDGGQLVATVTTVESGTPPATPPGVPIPGTRYFHVNNVRSTTLVTNEQGKVSCTVDYDPFGKPLRVDGSNDFRRKYTGFELDGSILYYASSRYYSPLLGGFITADTRLGAPEDVMGAFNRYAYVLNDPMTLMDPSGFGFFSSIGNFFTHTLPGWVKKAADKVSNFFTNTLPSWIQKNAETLLSCVFDVALIGLGVLASIFIPGLGGIIGSTLITAGIGGLFYSGGKLISGEKFSWGDWGAQVGVGALAGLIGGAFGAAGGVVSRAITFEFQTTLRAGIAATFEVTGGAIAGGAAQIANNAVTGEKDLMNNVGLATLTGGFGAGLGSAIGSKSFRNAAANKIRFRSTRPRPMSGARKTLDTDSAVSGTIGGVFGYAIGSQFPEATVPR